MKRRLTALAAVGILVATSITYARTADEDCFFRKANEARRSAGVPVLAHNSDVDKVAKAHSMEMAMRGTIYHNPNLAEELPPYRFGGENVGQGGDCASIHEAFMSSPGHRANILDPDYTQLGVGVTRDGDTIYVVEDFFTPKTTASKPKPPAATSRPTRRPPAKCT